MFNILRRLSVQSVVLIAFVSFSLQCTREKADADTSAREIVLTEIRDSMLKQLAANDLAGIRASRLKADSIVIEDRDTNITYHKIKTVVAKAAYRQGNYKDALEIVLDNLKVFDQHHDLEAKSDIQNLLGLIYLMQGRKDAALIEFRSAIAINTEIANAKRLAANYFNVGLVYREKQEFQKSKAYFEVSRNMSEKDNNEELKLMSINRLAESYEKNGKLDSAIYHYRIVLNSQKLHNDWEESFANTGLAECFVQQGDYQLSVTHALKGYSLARKVGAKWDVARAASILSSAYAKQQDFQNAFVYQEIDILYSDSLLAENKRIAMDSLQIAHQSTLNEQLSSEKNVTEYRFRISLLLVGILIVSTIATAIIFYITSRNSKRVQKLNDSLQIQSKIINDRNRDIERQYTALSESNRTKDYLLSVLSHDLRSPFSSILGLLDFLRGNAFADVVKPELFESLYFQTLATSTMVDNLILWADQQKSGEKNAPKLLHVAREVENIIIIMRIVAQQKSIEIVHLQMNAERLYFDPIHLQIMISNLVGNAIKFTRENGSIEISYARNEEQFQIIIRDNGVGMDRETIENLLRETGEIASSPGTNSEKGYGIGMQLVKRYARINNVNVAIESEVNIGTKFILTFSGNHAVGS